MADRRTFDVSVAWVRWGYTDNLARLVWVNLHKIYLAALLISAPPRSIVSAMQILTKTDYLPVYSGKYCTSGTFGNFCLNKSILLRKRITDVRRNHLELITDSKRTSDSCIRF